MPNIMKAVQFMIDTAEDDTHGYDQTHRNGPDYDCSSLVGTALNEAGFPVSPYSWTGNLEPQLRACGFVECKEPWLPGDIHLSRKHHVCMSISNQQIAHASINERGGVTGGKSGDQTGKEICIRDYYEYSKGWDVHLRYTGGNTDVPPKYSLRTIAKQVIAGKWGNGDERIKRLTSAGYDAKKVQAKVNKILANKEKKSVGELAREVYQGKWGNGAERKRRLEEAGYDYRAVQKRVNEMYASQH